MPARAARWKTILMKTHFTILIKDQVGNVNRYPIQFTDLTQAIKRAEKIAEENFCKTQVEKTELAWPQEDTDNPPCDWGDLWSRSEKDVPDLWIFKLNELSKRLMAHTSASVEGKPVESNENNQHPAVKAD